MPAKDWVWGPSANWKIYSSAKKTIHSRNGSFIRSISKIAGGYQDDLSRLYKNLTVKAGRIIKPQYYNFHSNGGNFGPLVNAVLTRSKRRHEAKSKYKRRFMNDQGNISLTKDEVDSILRKKEHTTFFESNLIARIDFNELASNRPMEDQTFAHQSCHDNSVIVGILDGHGGSMFGEFVKRYLPLYLSVSLLDTKIISNTDESLSADELIRSLTNDPEPVIDSFLRNHLMEFAKEIVEKNPAQIDPGTFSTYVRQLLGPSLLVGSGDAIMDTREISQSFKEAFVRLDLDMVNDVVNRFEDGALGNKDVGLTSSGCCALVARLSGSELQVANAGDCRAIMGSFHDGSWSAIQLTLDHTASEFSKISQLLMMQFHQQQEKKNQKSN